jgi:hypothetical protein
VLVIYVFTDASGLGFGDTFVFGDTIEYVIETWGLDEEKNPPTARNFTTLWTPSNATSKKESLTTQSFTFAPATPLSRMLSIMVAPRPAACFMHWWFE